MIYDVHKALGLWGLEDANFVFVAGRENRIYKVTYNGNSFALRFKRPGYRDRAELQSELDWLAEMARAGLSVPQPLPSLTGQLIEQVDGQYIDLITWMSGTPLGMSRQPLQLLDPIDTFFRLGAEMAKLHTACDAWITPIGFTRCVWDADGLLGKRPVWGRFWENPTLDAPTRQMFTRFREQAAVAMSELSLDMGLIHADLVRENVLVNESDLYFIDFDDGGFGYRLFDVATALLKNRAEPNYADLQNALINGYRSLRALDTAQLDLFLALRAATYVGWIVPRLAEDGARDRNTILIQDAADLCAAWLAKDRPIPRL
jgi:Ser/Thr protein kinase RdoA (MazF antagonist)